MLILNLQERKGKVRFEVRNANGTAIEGARFSIKQPSQTFHLDAV
jgi:hypothetical protein